MEITAEHMIAPTSASVMLGPTSNNFAHARTRAGPHTHVHLQTRIPLHAFSLPRPESRTQSLLSRKYRLTNFKWPRGFLQLSGRNYARASPQHHGMSSSGDLGRCQLQRVT